MDEIYAEKMETAFHRATLLVRALKSLSRDKYVKESAIGKEKYLNFLGTMVKKVEACQPSSESDEEKLTDWTG